MRGAIEDHFKFRLSRPEILNRIGDNIVVFDFITPEIGAQIFDGMLRNVVNRVRDEHKVDLALAPTCATSCASCARATWPTAAAASATSSSRCSSIRWRARCSASRSKAAASVTVTDLAEDENRIMHGGLGVTRDAAHRSSHSTRRTSR